MTIENKKTSYQLILSIFSEKTPFEDNLENFMSESDYSNCENVLIN